MKIQLSIGYGNGQKGTVTIDTTELPKKYPTLNGQAAISAKIIKENPNLEF